MRKLKEFVKWLWSHIVAFTGHAAGAAAVTVIATTLLAMLTWLKAVKDETSVGEFWAHPSQLISPAIITFLLMVVVSLFTIIRKQRNTLSSFGVRLFSKHDTPDAKMRDWSMLLNELVNANHEKSTLWLLGATGKETFSAPSAPLHDALQAYEGEIKILLIRPYSMAFEHRCRELNAGTNQYLEQILDSIDFCKDLVENGVAVDLKLYSTIPIWKMVMTPRLLWVQFYKKGRHVDDTPMYCFEFKGSGITLFDGFRAVFTKRWKYDDSHSVDLTKFVRSNWQETCLQPAV